VGSGYQYEGGEAHISSAGDMYFGDEADIYLEIGCGRTYWVLGTGMTFKMRVHTDRPAGYPQAPSISGKILFLRSELAFEEKINTWWAAGSRGMAQRERERERRPRLLRGYPQARRQNPGRRRHYANHFEQQHNNQTRPTRAGSNSRTIFTTVSDIFEESVECLGCRPSYRTTGLSPHAVMRPSQARGKKCVHTFPCLRTTMECLCFRSAMSLLLGGSLPSKV